MLNLLYFNNTVIYGYKKPGSIESGPGFMVGRESV